jgi:hypothetical protein
MPNTRTLTSANCILMLGVTGLYDTPRRIQGFSADDVSDFDQVNTSETSMGVDGRLSAGYVPVPVPQNIVLQADSESNDFFENWLMAEKQRREKYVAFGTIAIPSTQRKYAMTRGFLGTVSIVPAVRRTLQPRRYALTWENVTPAPF